MEPQCKSAPITHGYAQAQNTLLTKDYYLLGHLEEVKMKCYCWIAVASIVGCTASGGRGRDLIGQDSFALAARYGTPAGYQHQGEYLQLNYGSTAAGCQVIVLIDQAQRVAGWASSGSRCISGWQDGIAEPHLNVLD